MRIKETLFTKYDMYENLMAQFAENGLPKNSYIESIIKIDVICSLIIEFVQYFKSYDEVNKSCHSLLIKELYFNVFEGNKEDLCKKFCVSQSTLRRYRRRYVQTFIDIIESKYSTMEMVYL